MQTLNSNTLRAAAVGAWAGFAGFVAGEFVWRQQYHPSSVSTDDLSRGIDAVSGIVKAGMWVGAIGAVMGAILLAYDNNQSLRGHWQRDLYRGIPLFAALSFAGAAIAQIAYSIFPNDIRRGIGWALIGAGVGVGIGVLRNDLKQAAQGGLGGAIGGFIGGLIFNSLDAILSAYGDSGDGYYSRCAGIVITGMMVAVSMRIIQDALKDAWLLGVSTGPYEGREYPLNKDRVSVGRSEASDVALFREGALPEKLGTLVFQNGAWRWQGEPVEVNGKTARDVALASGDRLKLGDSIFRFNLRRMRVPVAVAPAAYPPAPSSAVPSVTVPTAPPSLVGAPPAISPAAGAAAAPLPATVSPGPPIATVTWSLKPSSGAASLRLPVVAGPITIGRDSSNTLVVSDSAVSLFHARIVAQARGLNIIDTDSTNGTFINDRRLVPNTPQGLAAGDRLKLAGSEFVVERE